MMYTALSPGALGFQIAFQDAAAVAERNGFKGYWFDIKKDLEPGVAAVQDLLKRHSLTPAGFGLPVNFRTDDATFLADLEQLSAHARNAQTLGLERCVTWLMPASDERTYQENFELHTRRLREVAAILRKHDIRLGLEFVGPATMRRGKKYEFVHNLSQTLDLCNAIGTGNVGLLMDVFHWDVAGQTDADFDLIPGADAVVLAHVNDAPKGRSPDEQLDNERGLPGGTGVLRIGSFFTGLAKLGYEGPVVVEPFSAPLKAMPFEAAVAAAMASLKRVWPKG